MISVPIRIALSTLIIIGQAVLADVVVMKSGRSVKGKLTGWNAGYVSISIGKPGEVVEHRMRREEIASIRFEDEPMRRLAHEHVEKNEYPSAFPLLKAIADRRALYLGLIDEDEETWLVEFLNACIVMNRYEEVLDRAKLWQPSMVSEIRKAEVAKYEIQAARNLNRLEETAQYARKWIDAERSSRATATAWLALARLALKEEKASEALWLSLQPIAFSDLLAPPDLNRCYVLAIESATSLGLHSYSEMLYEEMKARKLAWPDDGTMIDYQAILAKRESIPERKIADVFSSLSSPNEDASALANARRLVGQP